MFILFTMLAAAQALETPQIWLNAKAKHEFGEHVELGLENEVRTEWLTDIVQVKPDLYLGVKGNNLQLAAAYAVALKEDDGTYELEKQPYFDLNLFNETVASRTRVEVVLGDADGFQLRQQLKLKKKIKKQSTYLADEIFINNIPDFAENRLSVGLDKVQKHLGFYLMLKSKNDGDVWTHGPWLHTPIFGFKLES